MCAQSHALGTGTKFQLEILSINVISGIVYFRKVILESSRNVSETTPRRLEIQLDAPELDQNQIDAGSIDRILLVQGPISLTIFLYNSNVMAISFCSQPNSNEVIAT